MSTNDGTNVPLKNAGGGSSNHRQKRKQSDENLNKAHNEPQVNQSLFDPFVKLNSEEAHEILKYLYSYELSDAMCVSKLWKSTIESSAKAMDKILFKCTAEQINEMVDIMEFDEHQMDLKDFHRNMTSKRKYKHMEGDATLSVGNQMFSSCESSLVSAKILCNFTGREFSKNMEGGDFKKLQKLVIECEEYSDLDEFFDYDCDHHYILNFFYASTFPEVTHLRMCQFDARWMKFGRFIECFPKLKVLHIDDLPWEGPKLFKYKAKKNQPKVESIFMYKYHRDVFLGFKDSLKEICVEKLYMKNVKEILSNCKALESITVESLINSEPLPLSPHHKLKSLLIHEFDVDNEETMMELLPFLPALKTLILKCDTWGVKISKSFIEFLAKTSVEKFICKDLTVEAMECYKTLKEKDVVKFELVENAEILTSVWFSDDFRDRHFNNDKMLTLSQEDVKSCSKEDSVNSKQEKAFEVLLPELVKYLTFDERLDCMLVSKLWKSRIESSSMDKIVLKQTPAKIGDTNLLSLLKIMKSERKYKHMEGNCAISVGNYAFSNFASSLETLKIHCNMSEDHCKIANGNFIKLKKLFIRCHKNEKFYGDEDNPTNMDPCFHRPILNFIKKSSFPEVTHLRICPWDPKEMSYDELYKKFPKLKVLYAYEHSINGVYDSFDVKFEKFENQPKIESLCMSTWNYPLLFAFKDTLTEVYIDPPEFSIIAEVFRHLTNLKTFGIDELPDETLPCPFPHAKNLGKLLVDFYPDEDSLITFVKSQPSINNLIIKRKISENLVRLIATKAENLRELSCESAPEDVMELYETIKNSEDNDFVNTTFEIHVDRFMMKFYVEFQQRHFRREVGGDYFFL